MSNNFHTTHAGATGPAAVEGSTFKRIEWILALAVAIFGAAAIVYWRMQDQDLAAALYGFSPTALMSDFWFRPAFAANYPSGEEELFRSLILQVFPLAGQLGIGKAPVMTFMLGLEVLMLAAGATFATLRLNRSATLPQALLTAVFLFASTLASGNLARWGHPFYGSVYNYAYGAGLTGIALILTNAPKRGAFFIAMTVVIHPLLGLLFGIFGACAVLSDIRRYRLRDLVWAAAVFALCAGPWLLWSLHDAQIATGTIPADLFVSLTRMMGYHWFPISQELFGRLGYERFAPFLGFLVLIGLYLFHDRRPLSLIERRIAAGLAGLAITTVFGLLAAEFSGSPLFIKMALHRASVVLLFVGTLFVVPGLLWDAANGPLWRMVPAALMLVVPFFDPYGAPIVLPLVLGLAAMAESLVARGWKGPHPVLCGALLLAGAGLVWLVASGNLSIGDSRYTGADLLFNPLAVGLAVALLALRALRLQTLFALVIGVGAVVWSPALVQFTDDATRERARSYLEAENWAKDNAATDALFMVDPGQAYGWREFSERPSFGSVREWLYAGWIYNSRRSAFDDGLERLAFFGVDVDEVLARDRAEPDYAKARLPGDLQQRYYNAPLAWFEEAAREFGIDYFVFDESLAHDIPGLETVYRNEGYSIRRLSAAPPPDA